MRNINDAVGTLLRSMVLVFCWCTHTGLAKVFEVSWDVPADGLILASVSTAKCGDVVRFRCPAGATQGVFRMTSVNGTCPQSFDLLSTGVVLSAPTKSCDFSLVLGDEPDFFVTSQAGAACQNNLKMNIHSVCPQKTGVAAGSVLSMNSAGSLGSSAGGWSTGIVPGSRFTQTESMQSPLAAAQNAYSSTAMGQQQEGLQEAGAAQNAAARSAASLLGLAAVTVAVRVAVLL